MRTAREIILQTELLAEKISEICFSAKNQDGSTYRKAEHPKAQAAWQAACAAQELLTETDVKDAVTHYDDNRRQNLYERLCLTALGQSYFEEALQEAYALQELTEYDKNVIERYLRGKHRDMDHVDLQKIAIKILEGEL